MITDSKGAVQGQIYRSVRAAATISERPQPHCPEIGYKHEDEETICVLYAGYKVNAQHVLQGQTVQAVFSREAAESLRRELEAALRGPHRLLEPLSVFPDHRFEEAAESDDGEFPTSRVEPWPVLEFDSE